MTPSVFGHNPRRRELQLDDASLEALLVECADQFDDLPLYHSGESAELRRTPIDGILVQRFLPSLNSISSARKGIVAGTQRIRLEISRLFWGLLHRAGLSTAHLATDGEHVLVTEERVAPVEVIVKAAMVGTPTRVYTGLIGRRDRFGTPIRAGEQHAPYVRFDYRNPLRGEHGELLRDECMPVALAERLIDTHRASAHALAAFRLVADVLLRIELVLLDACFLYDESGDVLTYELSPDNMRIKRADRPDGPAAKNAEDETFDKDLWRSGADPRTIVAQWQRLHAQLMALETAQERIAGPGDEG